MGNEYVNTFFDGVYIFCGRGPQLDWAAVRGGLRQGRADGLSWLLTLVGLAPGAGIGSPAIATAEAGRTFPGEAAEQRT